MKKFLKSLLAASLGLVAVVGFASCEKTPTPLPTEKTETPAPQFDCANGVHDAATEWSSDNTKHWHACSLCDKLVDKEAHKWGEWTVTKEATLTEKGSRWHECSVCGKKLEEEIPMLKPESVVAAEDVAIYVKAPEGWAAVNCYWWYKGEDGTEYGSTTWPGEAMTQVDAENNIWGFVYPKGANRVIFNSDGVQTVDLEFKSTNYYILQAEATDKFDVEQYTTYTPAADQPELNKYTTAMPTGPVEVEMTTIYAQLPEAWTGHYIYYWGSQGAACPAWPGTELTVVDAAKHLYSAEVPADLGGFCLSAGVDAEGNTIDQTGDLALVEGVNAYIVQPVDGKDTAKLANYKDGVLTEIVVAIPLPDMNIKGSMNGWADNDAYKFTYDAATDTATFELTVAPGDAFKVAAVGAWSPQFNSQNSTLADGLKAGEGNDLENIVVEKGGKYLITISGCKDSATATCVFTVVEHQQIIVPVPDMYIAGSHNGWGDAFANNANKLVLDYKKENLSLSLYLAANTEFKVTDSSWGLQYGFGATGLTYAEGLFTDAGGNLKVVKSGIYKVNVTNLADKTLATCEITLTHPEMSLVDAKAAAKDTLVYITATVKSISGDTTVLTDGENELNVYKLGHTHVGDTVSITGKMSSYNDTPQISNPAIINIINTVINTSVKTIVSDVNQLKDGSQVIIAFGNKIMGAQTGNYRTQVFGLHEACSQVVTLVKSGDNWLLQVGEGQYLVAVAGENHLKTDASTSNAEWIIAIEEGVTTIKNATTGAYLQYNASSPRFSGYESGSQNNPTLYVLDSKSYSAYADHYAQVATSGNVFSVKAAADGGNSFTLGNGWRTYVVVDAEGRICYFVEGFAEGYGNVVETSFARHSMYADKAKNPAFANIGTEAINQWGSLAFDLVVPEGGFAISAHNYEALIKYITGSYTAKAVNSSQYNVDNLRLSYDADTHSIKVVTLVSAETIHFTEDTVVDEENGLTLGGIIKIAAGGKWAVETNGKKIIDVTGTSVDTTHRLKSGGKDQVANIDLTSYSADETITITFYVLSSSNTDLNRKLSISNSDGVEISSFTCDIPSNDASFEGANCTCMAYTVSLAGNQAYKLSTVVGAINFHAINVVVTK